MNNTAYTPSDADRKAAEQAQERADYSICLPAPELLDIVVEKALDSSATSKSVLDAAEFAYKVSGEKAGRAERQGRFVFNIISRREPSPWPRRCIEHEAPSDTAEKLVEEAAPLLDAIPEYAQSVAFTNDLDIDISDLDD